MSIERKNFGQTSSGEDVELYLLSNQNGMTLKVMTYGGIVQAVTLPDGKDNSVDVVLGFDTLKEYEA